MPHADFVVDRLRPEQILVVYPLIRSVDRSITRQQWLRWARPLSAQRSDRRGALVAQRRSQPHPSGVICYRAERRIGAGSVLVADHLAVLDLLLPQSIIVALVTGLDQIAAALRCDRVVFFCEARDQQLLQTLRALGNGAEAVSVSRAVGQLAENGVRSRISVRHVLGQRPPLE